MSACDTCGGAGRVEWMIEGDPNCYQERDSDDMIPCPDCAPAMTDETPDPYRTIPTSSYTTAKLRLTDANGNGVEISLNLAGDDTRVSLETSPETRIENPVTGAEEVTAINLRLTVEDAPQPWSVERVGEW